MARRGRDCQKNELSFLVIEVSVNSTSVMGHVWTVPAVQEEFDYSGAVMYSACCRLEDYLCRDAAVMAAGPDVIR
jgi:hypothetical protein